MNKDYFINNKHYKKFELLELAENKVNKKNIPEWESDFYGFIIDWFSEKETITIKTSGSTGNPKNIELSKSNMVLSAKRTIDYFKLSKGNKLLLCLSVKYIAGMMQVIRAFEGGMNLISISPQQINSHFNNSLNIDFAALVPIQLEQLFEANLQNKFRKIIIGGSPLPLNLSEKIKSNHIGKAWETYGMTETITHVAIYEINNNNTRIFHALPNIKFKTDNRECLIIFDSLLNSTIITNDRVELISDTAFVLLGRVDNVINSGGVKIQPEDIEATLINYIKNRFVITSIPDDKLGDKMILIIEKENDIELLKTKIQDILPTYKQPKSIIEMDKIPLNNNGKVDYVSIKNYINKKDKLRSKIEEQRIKSKEQ
jgi:O-succinylbenzoic acid--CoA ligase